MKFPIFMDNHSTTPMDPRVLEVMLPYFIEKFGNAASRNHQFGWEAEEGVENARKQIAKLIHCDPKELVFTSGATESDNLALKGAAEMYKEKGNHVITSMTEHRAVLDACKALEKRGLEVTYLAVDKEGRVNPQDVRKAAELCEQEMTAESHRIAAMRDRLQARIMEKLDECYLNGHPTERLPNNLNISFAYVEGEALLMGVKEIALSSGSACTSATLEPSYVLRALGVGSDLAHSSIRFGLGRFNTDEEVDYTAKRMVEAVTRLREMSPLYEMAKEGIDLKSVQWAAH